MSDRGQGVVDQAPKVMNLSDRPSAVPGPTEGRGPVPLAGLLAVLVLTLLAALVATGGGPVRGLAGLPDAGQLTGWGLPLTRVLMHASAVVTVGTLVTATLLLHAPGFAASPLTGDRLDGVRRAAPWAGGWALLALLSSALTVSEVQGRPLWQLPLSDLPAAAWDLPQARALLLVAPLAGAVAAGARRANTVLGGWVLFATACLALLPAVLSGHGAGHGLQTVEAIALHVLASSLWVGGLLGLVRLGRRSGGLDPSVVQRFSVLALGCFLVVVASGLVSAAQPLLEGTDVWSSPYARLVLSKVFLLVLLGVAGWQHRRRSLPALAAGRSGAFRRLAVAELVVMAAAAGLAVALGRTAPPLPSPAQEAAEVTGHGATHASLLAGVPPFSPSGLLTQWRPDVLMLTLVALAVWGYAAAVRRARAAGRDWPAACIAAAAAAAVVGVLAWNGGLAVYAPAMLSVQVAQLLVVLLALPVLLLLSVPAPAGRDHTPDPPAHDGAAGDRPSGGGRLQVALRDPVNGLALLLVVLIGLYSTPLLELSSRSPVVNLIVTVGALCVGTAVLWPLVGSAAARLSPRRSRAGWLGGILLILALLALRLATQERLLAEAWFVEFELAWVDPAVEQQRASLVVLAFLLVGLVGLVPAVVPRRPAPPAAPVRSGFTSASRQPSSVAGRRNAERPSSSSARPARRQQ